MKISITRGWHSMKEQFYILILLFIYRLFWGYFMYKFIKSAVVPVLLRYPDADAGGSSIGRLLYYIEGQAALHTDPDVRQWLWLLLALTVLRLLLSPLSGRACCTSFTRNVPGSADCSFSRDEALWSACPAVQSR